MPASVEGQGLAIDLPNGDGVLDAVASGMTFAFDPLALDLGWSWIYCFVGYDVHCTVNIVLLYVETRFARTHH